MTYAAIDWEARIEAIRAEAGPLLCPTCGSTTPEVIEQKWCATCERMLPIANFAKDKHGVRGRRWFCKECSKAYCKAYRIRVAKSGGRGDRGGVVKISGTTLPYRSRKRAS